MWGAIVQVGLWVLDKFWPSKERELGRAEAENVGLKANAKQVKNAAKAVRSSRADAAKRVSLRRKARKAGDG